MLNHIVIMGRLTRDPELRRTSNDTAVASFTLAVDRDFKSKDTQEKETDFIDCVAWRSTAEFVSKYFTKGRMAVVSGRLQVRSYTDKEGNKRKAAEIVVDNVYFGDSKNQSSTGSYEASSPSGNAYSGGYQSYSAPAQSSPAPAAANKGSYGSSDFSILEDDDNSLPF